MSKNTFKQNVNFARIAGPPSEKKEENLCFNEEVYQNLPKCLQPFFQFPSRRKNDMFLNAMLPALGLILWNASGSYGQRSTIPI